MSFFNDVEEYFENFFNDPTQLILILVISVCSAIFMVWLEGDKKVNPMQGSGFMKGYKKPDIPPKSMKELVTLEKRDTKLPLIDLKELALKNGQKDTPWVCVKGVIYDVSANEVYKEKGGYNLFSGKDASYSLATMLFDKIDDRDWRKCTKEQLECLDEWTYYYKDRYKIVGYLKEEY